jgi:hypothetical protein
MKLWIVAIVLVAIGLVGCMRSDRPKTIPITGKVTIDGQPPGERGKIHFTPTEAAEGYEKRPATGAFDVDGVYRVMSWSPDDGLVPGHYMVNVVPGNSNTTKILARYRVNGTSGLQVEVPVDKDEINYDIELVTQ